MNRTSILALAAFVVLAALVLAMKLPAAQRVQAAVIGLVRPIHTTTTGVGRNLAPSAMASRAWRNSNATTRCCASKTPSCAPPTR